MESNESQNKQTGTEGTDGDPGNQLPLPPAIRRRVNALRKLQLAAINVETEFYKKVHELECEYAERLAPLNDKRRLIVNGVHEPNDDESNIAVPLDEKFLSEELQKQAAINSDLPESEKKLDPKGIDEFWLTVLRNSNAFAGVIEYYDEPVLKHLTDIDLKVGKDPMVFTLTFHFSSNEYFTDNTLTKEYTMKCQPEDNDPFSYMGPEIVNCKGCQIDWKPDKNVTMRVVNKKQKHKQKGSTRIVAGKVKVESFFDFFEPPTAPEGEEISPETLELLSVDYELGQLLRDRIIPRAVLYYTGEMTDEDEDEEYDEEEEADQDFDELEEESGENVGEQIKN